MSELSERNGARNQEDFTESMIMESRLGTLGNDFKL